MGAARQTHHSDSRAGTASFSSTMLGERSQRERSGCFVILRPGPTDRSEVRQRARLRKNHGQVQRSASVLERLAEELSLREVDERVGAQNFIEPGQGAFRLRQAGRPRALWCDFVQRLAQRRLRSLARRLCRLGDKSLGRRGPLARHVVNKAGATLWVPKLDAAAKQQRWLWALDHHRDGPT